MRPLVLPLTVCDVVIQAVSVCKLWSTGKGLPNMNGWLEHVDSPKQQTCSKKKTKSDV